MARKFTLKLSIPKNAVQVATKQPPRINQEECVQFAYDKRIEYVAKHRRRNVKSSELAWALQL